MVASFASLPDRCLVFRMIEVGVAVVGLVNPVFKRLLFDSLSPLLITNRSWVLTACHEPLICVSEPVLIDHCLVALAWMRSDEDHLRLLTAGLVAKASYFLQGFIRSSLVKLHF